jgi:hypothetical protein
MRIWCIKIGIVLVLHIYIYIILQFNEFRFEELLFVLFLYLLTVFITLSTVIDDIIPFGSRGRQHFQDIMNFPIKRSKVRVKK